VVLGGLTGAGAAAVGAVVGPIVVEGVVPGPRDTLKYAHVSNSPRRDASSAPLMIVLPLDPSTAAVRMRGEEPRRSTSIPRNAPRNLPRRRTVAL